LKTNECEQERYKVLDKLAILFNGRNFANFVFNEKTLNIKENAYLYCLFRYYVDVIGEESPQNICALGPS